MNVTSDRAVLLAARIEHAKPCDHIDIERFDLAHPALSEAWVDGHLTDEERAQAARLVHPEKGRRFAAARALRRTLLADMLGLPPARLAFETGPHGKPALAGAHIPFSLSHSGDRLVMAASNTREVGVDIEELGAGRDVAGVARNFFSDADRAALGEPISERAFLRIWTAKEAVLKALGVGLQRPMREVALDTSAFVTLHQDAWRPEAAEMDGAAFELFDVSQEGDVACLALQTPAG